ncbi:oxidoreductase [Nonomuraea jabiensis]|uniref:NAD(P)-dependent dehydrogenase (Short-subunit alcohol dehydrogenase family) n=1 Tax=Nonomuraea jabiensis TaxID=882448 RepID=A0A7W9GG94_9ACTN|nr:oxidoreductase [Nonomuraea jabiensis]MBB5783240.1 NAD(P)-dependent dehydrogenase (short-subunit alcohol dehydrogenase family) [Nonomuraea jabiensis]
MATWFLTGASRGFGLELARQILAGGDTLIATARRPEGLRERLGASERLITEQLDVTDPAGVQAAVTRALAQVERVDVLVNNAGYGVLGAVEEISETQTKEIYDVNVFGLLRVTKALLPTFRRQRAGHIINVSSIGGVATGAAWGLYGSTKFAVEGITDALRAEVGPLGIHVTAVRPGVFRTDFLSKESLVIADGAIDDYADTSGQARASVADWGGSQPGDPVKAAEAIIRIARTANPPRGLLLGGDAVRRRDQVRAEEQREVNAWRELSLSTDYAATS